MFAELVKLKLPAGFTREDALADARTTLERWSANPDLLRKHYLFGEDGCAYGFYVWKTREAAAKGHDAAWQEHARERIGEWPEITPFDVMMILDNEAETATEFPKP